MRQTVVILGGGIGGMSTAHELADRGFEVRVFESKPIFGGKAIEPVGARQTLRAPGVR